MRIFLALAMMAALLFPAVAQDEATPWRDAVTGQIEAIRAGDGDAALGFAGEAFRTQFAGQGEAFYAAIMRLGYTPIAESRSHSFGSFDRAGENVVIQVVNFIGSDQGLYEAIYQLGDEEGEGWRVLGVVLKKTAGVAV